MPKPENIKTGGDAEFEIRFYERVVKEAPNYLEALIPLAELYTKTGDHQKGLQTDKRIAVLCPDDDTVFYNLACSYALVGEKDMALETLEKAAGLGYCDAIHMKKDEDLKSLHGEAGFQQLLARLAGRD